MTSRSSCGGKPQFELCWFALQGGAPLFAAVDRRSSFSAFIPDLVASKFTYFVRPVLLFCLQLQLKPEVLIASSLRCSLGFHSTPCCTARLLVTLRKDFKILVLSEFFEPAAPLFDGRCCKLIFPDFDAFPQHTKACDGVLCDAHGPTR